MVGSGAFEPQVAFLATYGASFPSWAIVIGMMGHLVAVITIGDATKLTQLWCHVPSDTYQHLMPPSSHPSSGLGLPH